MKKGNIKALVTLLSVTIIVLSTSNPISAEESESHDDSTPPVPIFEIEGEINESPEPMPLDASLSYDPGSDSNNLRYIWSGTRGADNIEIDYHENESFALMPIGVAGTYKIRLTVFDPSLNSATLEHEIRVIDVLPQIHATFASQVISSGASIEHPDDSGPWSINATGSTDGGSEVADCEWYLDDSIWLEGCKHSIQEWPAVGFESRNVRLEVLDDDGSLSSMEFILVNEPQEDLNIPLYLALGALLIAGTLASLFRRRSNFDIPKWPSRVSGEDHMLK
ncbi:MAG: hypothetical protein CMA72_03180 [Euryarchaeota archaeon]|nr:hypothetical protein [Euryarchaeota archaeon]